MTYLFWSSTKTNNFFILIDWFLVFNATFSNIMVTSFSDGRSWSTWWEPPTMGNMAFCHLYHSNSNTLLQGSLWSYGSWIYNYPCNQCLSPYTNVVGLNPAHGEVYVMQHYAIYIVCQWLAAGGWLSPGTRISSTNKTDRHDITKILLKVALNTITLTKWHHDQMMQT